MQVYFRSVENMQFTYLKKFFKLIFLEKFAVISYYRLDLGHLSSAAPRPQRFASELARVAMRAESNGFAPILPKSLIWLQYRESAICSLKMRAGIAQW